MSDKLASKKDLKVLLCCISFALVQILTFETRADEIEPLVETGKTYYGKYNYWVSYGMGSPTEKYKAFTKHITLGLDSRFSPKFWSGFFIERISGTIIDNVHFENTGYDEAREYDVTSYILGPHFTWVIDDNLYFVLGFGLSMLQSELTSVTTTAPIPSTLEPGQKKTIAGDLGYNLGGRYEYHLGDRTDCGVELGYSVSSAKNAEASIKDIYASIYFRLNPEADR